MNLFVKFGYLPQIIWLLWVWRRAALYRSGLWTGKPSGCIVPLPKSCWDRLKQPHDPKGDKAGSENGCFNALGKNILYSLCSFYERSSYFGSSFCWLGLYHLLNIGKLHANFSCISLINCPTFIMNSQLSSALNSLWFYEYMSHIYLLPTSCDILDYIAIAVNSGSLWPCVQKVSSIIRTGLKRITSYKNSPVRHNNFLSFNLSDTR